MQIRARTTEDVGRCVDLARAVHELDGYPPHLGAGLEPFIRAEGCLAAWVAEDDGLVVGHVVLSPTSSSAVMALAQEALRLPPEGLGVVARLLVAPGARRRGAGRGLLGTASHEALARGLWPVLDVACHFAGAVRFYERCGWARAGRVTTSFRDGTSLEEFVYLAPRGPGTSSAEASPAEPIYHLAVLADWDPAAGEYRGSTLGKSLGEVGFVHCSTAAQLRQVADLFYRGRHDVVLLKIDPEKLGVPVRYEELPDGERFPHVYGPVAMHAVLSATPLRAGADGLLELGGFD